MYSFARPLFSAALLALAAAGCDFVDRQAEAEAEALALKADMQRFVDAAEKGEAAPPAAQAGPMPRGKEARALWILRRLAGEIPFYADSLSKEHGVNLNVLPAAWQTPEYLAGASRHPEVRDYFVRWRAYLTEASQGLRLRTNDRMEALLAEAEIGPYDASRMRDGYESTYPESLALMRHTERAVKAALAYHDFLAEADPHISLSGGQVVFAREHDLSRAQALESHMIRYFQSVAMRQRDAAHRAQARMDSLQSVVAGRAK